MTIVLSLVYLRLPFEMVERNVTVEKNQIKMLNVLFPHPWPKNSSLAPGRGQKVFFCLMRAKVTGINWERSVVFARKVECSDLA